MQEIKDCGLVAADEVDWLLERLRRGIEIRNELRTTNEAGTLNYEISVYANRPWADFFENLDATKALLRELCPGWVYLGEWIIGEHVTAWIGHSETGEIRETNRVSNPVTLSLLTLIVETHIHLLSTWIDQIQSGRSEEIRKFLDCEFRSPYILGSDESWFSK